MFQRQMQTRSLSKSSKGKRRRAEILDWKSR